MGADLTLEHIHKGIEKNWEDRLTGPATEQINNR